MMSYKVIEVFTSEDTRWQGKPVFEAILDFVNGLRVSARCSVFRGIAGCYENGELSTMKLEILSFKMPLKIEIVLPAAEAERVLAAVREMVDDGVVGVRDLNVVSHRTEKHLVPRHLRVRDVMSSAPVSFSQETSLGDIVRLLLSVDFNSVPIVDADSRPIGVVTQGDLISRGGMPVRLGLMEQLESEHIDSVLDMMAGKTAKDVMTSPAVTVRDDERLSAAVDTMLEHNLKRLPVVDDNGKLVGILARIDIFRTITEDAPDWKGMRDRNIVVGNLRTVRDAMRPDARTVAPSASVEDVLRMIDSNDIQRVVVVDENGKFLGLISDRDLLRHFSGHEVSVWDLVMSKFAFTKTGQHHREIVEPARKKKAGDVMQTGVLTIGENATLDEAIRMMTEKQIKRLPVVDEGGRFLGILSRDSLLRAGTHRQAERMHP